MVTIKRSTIQTKKFEHEIISVINKVKRMEISAVAKNEILTALRTMQNNCYEWYEEERSEK